MATLTARQTTRIEAALRAFGEAQFACGEWDRNEAEESYDRVWSRAERAEAALRKALGLPPKTDAPEIKATPVEGAELARVCSGLVVGDAGVAHCPHCCNVDENGNDVEGGA